MSGFRPYRALDSNNLPVTQASRTGRNAASGLGRTLKEMPESAYDQQAARLRDVRIRQHDERENERLALAAVEAELERLRQEDTIKCQDVLKNSLKDVCPLCIDVFPRGGSYQACDHGHPLHLSCFNKMYYTNGVHICPICRGAYSHM